MNYHINKTNINALPKWSKPSTKLLEEIKEDGFKILIDHFYDLVAQSDIANFFPQDKEGLQKVKEHNLKFFLEISGGKPLYTKENGDVDMVRAHKPFSISEKARVEWLGCLKEVLETTQASDEAKQSFWDYCEAFSSHLVNSALHQVAYEELSKDRW